MKPGRLRLLAVVRPLSAFNKTILRIGRGIGVVAVAFMVVAILIQVIFRYVLNNALPWPDEAARFCMLWMMASLLVCVVLLAIVNVELVLRSIIMMLGSEDDPPPIDFVELGGTD